MVKIILSGEAHVGKKYELQHKNLLDKSDCLFLEGVKSDSDNKQRDILYPIFLITLRAYLKASDWIYHPKKTLVDYAKERGIPVYPRENLTLSQIYDLANPILKISLIISIFLGCLTFYLLLFFLLKDLGLGLAAYNLIFIFISCIIIPIVYSIGIASIVSKARERQFAEKTNEIIKKNGYLKPVIVFGQIHLRGLKNNFEKMGYSTESKSKNIFDKWFGTLFSYTLYILYDSPWLLVLIVLLLYWGFKSLNIL